MELFFRMYKCNVCHSFECLDLSVVLRYICGHKFGSEINTWCPSPDCDLKFVKYDTLYKHCKKEYKPDTYHETGDDGSDNFENTMADDSRDNDDNSTNDDNEISEDENSVEDFLHDAALKFILLLKSCKISNVDTNNIMSAVSDFFNTTKELLSKSACVYLREKNLGILADGIKSALDAINNPLAGLCTTYRQVNALEETLPYVEPRKVVLGKTVVTVGDQSTIKDETMVYIPIQESIQQLLRKDEIQFYCRESPMTLDEAGFYYDITDGHYMKSEMFFKVNGRSFSLILFHYTLEICNPLGSRKTKHKIVNFYFVLVNIPPRLRSRLSSLRLVTMVKSGILKKYGFELVLSPFIEDMKKLYSGLEFEMLSSTEKIPGMVVACTGDTEGQHQIGGFKVSNICKVPLDCSCESVNLI